MLHVNEDEKSPWTARKSKPGPTCKETKAEFLEGKKKLWLTVTRDQLYLHSCHACTYFLWFTSFFTSSKDLCINAPWSSTTRMCLLCYYSFGNQLKIILLTVHTRGAMILLAGCILCEHLYPSKGMHSFCTTTEAVKLAMIFSKNSYSFKWIHRACKFGRFSLNLTRTFPIRQGTKGCQRVFFKSWIFFLWWLWTQQER